MSARERKEAPRNLLELYQRARKVLDMFLPVVEFVEALESTADLESRIIGVENYRDEVAIKVREIDQSLEDAKLRHSSSLRSLSDELEAYKREVEEQKLLVDQTLREKQALVGSLERKIADLVKKHEDQVARTEVEIESLERARDELATRISSLRAELKAVVAKAEE